MIAAGIIFAAKRIFKNCLSSRMQYHLWFLFLILMAIPFLPIHLDGFHRIITHMKSLTKIVETGTAVQSAKAVTLITENNNYLNDFAVSISQKTPSFIGTFLFILWLTGILIILIYMIKSLSYLHQIKRSALPLQNQDVCRIYNDCLNELRIRREIPLLSSVYLKSPSLIGSFKPCIILPHHIILDFDSNAKDLRYIFLHELQHYKHKDNFVNILMNLGTILYWFNPLIQISLKQMRNDREIACDTAVLHMLNENEYLDYGNTLINLAEKLSFITSPFATGISGTTKQIKQRIITIASYNKATYQQQKKGITAFIITTAFLLAFTPALSTYASNDAYYWDSLNAVYNTYNQDSLNAAYKTYDQGSLGTVNVFSLNLADSFKEMEGTFVLYDTSRDTWHIYNEELARTRFSPVSTYKIYDTLLALEECIISPEDTQIFWDGTSQPFEAWELDQTLSSAMKNSVNWYFQTLDAQIGIDTIQNYLKEINYGNETTGTNISTYWGDGSLIISPIEQVKLLKQLNQEELSVKPQNVDIVKSSLLISDHAFDSSAGTLYGKTGTARIQDRNVHGWFIGFIETSDNAYYFATLIRDEDDATGNKAFEITQEIFKVMYF